MLAYNCQTRYESENDESFVKSFAYLHNNNTNIAKVWQNLKP